MDGLIGISGTIPCPTIQLLRRPPQILSKLRWWNAARMVPTVRFVAGANLVLYSTMVVVSTRVYKDLGNTLPWQLINSKSA